MWEGFGCCSLRHRQRLCKQQSRGGMLKAQLFISGRPCTWLLVAEARAALLAVQQAFSRIFRKLYNAMLFTIIQSKQTGRSTPHIRTGQRPWIAILWNSKTDSNSKAGWERKSLRLQGSCERPEVNSKAPSQTANTKVPSFATAVKGSSLYTVTGSSSPDSTTSYLNEVKVENKSAASDFLGWSGGLPTKR